ncbi:MAG: hypothetical protein M5R42_18675 [Rhodocyclaceae bacterium]|nr:hypothetical protein [Rhodocyclaceae bacterium]
MRHSIGLSRPASSRAAFGDNRAMWCGGEGFNWSFLICRGIELSLSRRNATAFSRIRSEVKSFRESHCQPCLQHHGRAEKWLPATAAKVSST